MFNFATNCTQITHSLKSFTGNNEPDNLDKFVDIQSIKNELSVKKDRKGSKRKRLEQSEDFLTTTSAFTAPMRNMRIRATSVPTPRMIEKESKGDNSDNDSTEDQIFSSLNEFSNENTAPDFAQPIEKPPL